MLQVGGQGHRPWLSVGDRSRPMLRARRGHGRDLTRIATLGAIEFLGPPRRVPAPSEQRIRRRSTLWRGLRCWDPWCGRSCPDEHAPLAPAPQDRFCVRDLRGIAATCGWWGSVRGDLGGWRADADRVCPLRSGRLWPGCGPDVAQCYGHEDGTAGEDDGARAWKRRPPARAMVRPDQGDTSLVGRVRRSLRQVCSIESDCCANCGEGPEACYAFCFPELVMWVTGSLKLRRTRCGRSIASHREAWRGSVDRMISSNCWRSSTSRIARRGSGSPT